MATTTAFLVGLFAAIAAVAGSRYVHPLLGLGVVAVMTQISLFVSSRERWAYRAARSLIGGVVAGGAALAAVFILKNITDWYEWPADSGGLFYLIFLMLVAAIPSVTAAASPSPRAGAAMAIGFGVGLSAWMMRTPQPVEGIVVLVAIGTAIGTVLSAATRTTPPEPPAP